MLKTENCGSYVLCPYYDKDNDGLHKEAENIFLNFLVVSWNHHYHYKDHQNHQSYHHHYHHTSGHKP